MDFEIPQNEQVKAQEEDIEAIEKIEILEEKTAEPFHSITPKKSASAQSYIFAALVMMAGVILLANNFNLLPSFNNAEMKDWMILGAGVVVFMAAIARNFSPEKRGVSIGGMVLGGVLIGVGASRVFAIEFEWFQLWPLLLIFMGIAGLANAFKR